MKKYVWCTLQLEGMHNWKNCNLDDVMFLKNPHRHMFHFKCVKEVTHNDRDIEFIILKRQITRYLLSKWGQDNTLIFNSMSCEMIAEDLLKEFLLTSCSVSEDGENGGTVHI